MQEIIQTIKSGYDAFLAFFADLALSLADFIKDLAVILLKGVMSLAMDALTWASDACTYCQGSTSVFAQQLQAAYNALSPCVIYALTKSGMVANLQILSITMTIWVTMRVFSLIKAML